jgi:SHS2 domain-containing protein
MYRTTPHTADVGLWIESEDLNSLFAEAGQALFSLIIPDLSKVECRVTEQFKLEADDLAFLLVDWLNELLGAFDSRRLLFAEFSVVIEDGFLTATARGEPFDESRHELEHEAKAVTYHGLSVERQHGKWTAMVVVDI